MGVLKFAIVLFGVFLIFWSEDTNLIQGSKDLDLENVNTWIQENLKKQMYVEETVTGIEKQNKEIGHSNYGVSLFGRLERNGRIEQIGKQFQLGDKKSLEPVQEIGMTQANSKKDKMSQGGKDFKTPIERKSLEDKNHRLMLIEDYSANKHIKRKRERRDVHQGNKKEGKKEGFPKPSRYKTTSTSSQNTTCLTNCTTIKHIYHDGKTDCYCDICCSRASHECCKKQRMLGLGHYTISMSPTHCNCSHESSKSNHRKKHFVRSECVNGYWMITSCSSSWLKDEITYKCTTGASMFFNKTSLEDLHALVPVFTPSRKVFRNRYCAICNNETNFKPYKLHVKCKTTPPANYSPKKAREFLFSRCDRPKWEPQDDQPSQPCPQVHLSCSDGGKRDRKISQSLRMFGEFNVSIKSTDSHSYCVSCKEIESEECLVSSSKERNSVLKTASLSFIFDIMDDAEKPTLEKITCPIEKPVYDPYLEECRYGLIPPPKNAPFDSYRIRLFIEKSFTFPPLEDFKEFLEKEFRFEVYRLRYFSQGYQFDTRIGRMSNYSANNYKLNNYLNFTSQFNITLNNITLNVYKVTYRILTCADLEYFEKHEYAILHGYMPAVYLNKSREIISYSNYYSGSNDTISVCRLRLMMGNCAGAYIPLERDEYKVFKNNSIIIKKSGKMYDQKNYDIYNGTIWICVEFARTFSVYKRSRKLSPLALSVLTFVCMCLSIIGLVFVLVTYSLFSELRTPPGINLMNLSVSILLAQLLWLLGSGQTDTPMACTVIAIILHYLFLVSFLWTSIIAFDTWRAFSAKGRRPLADSKSERMKHCLRHMAVGWLPAMVYVAVCVGLENLDVISIGYGSNVSCFIHGTKAKLYFFMVPVIFFIIFNFVFFVLTVKAIKQTRSQTTKLTGHQVVKKQEFQVYLRIASLMGFTWIFGFAAPFGWQFLWYPFVILNGLQGVYIALAFGLGRYARKLYLDLYNGNRRGDRKRQSTSRGGRRERSTKESLL